MDIQVSLLTAGIVMASLLCVYLFNYHLTYQDMLEGLRERSECIYQYVEEKLDKSTFQEIQTYEDRDEASYQEMKGLLEDIKGATGVMYLYTAKRAQDGTLIYVIDGLPADSPDFRNPGDPIEEEIWDVLELALEDNVVLPQDIKSTGWGNIFISYFPIHDGERVVGVLGIEFNADRQYETFRAIRLGTPLIALLTCFLAVVIALHLFKRISNPTFRDLANTDYLTGLKNRNAFELDMSNLSGRRELNGYAVISIDLNDLKQVNDRLGHQAGDKYIQAAAEIIRACVGGGQALYRTGGDEYVVLLHGKDGAQIEGLVADIHDRARQYVLAGRAKVSMSIGYAQYEGEDDSLYDTYRRADMRMYENKKSSKGQRQNA